jgi:hypothetical protein
VRFLESSTGRKERCTCGLLPGAVETIRIVFVFALPLAAVLLIVLMIPPAVRL